MAGCRRQLAGGHCLLANPGGGSSGGGWPDLAILHDSRALAADVDLAVSFLYVVAFGIDVVKETQLAAASYFPGRFFFSVDLWTERLASST